MKLHFSSLTAALLLAMGTAQAATVEIYGTVDTGLLYTHESVDVKNSVEGSTHENDSSFGVASGTNTSSVIGIRGTEKISDELSVGFVLEHSFNSDDGSFGEDGKMFDKESQLYLNSSFGTVSLGRMGALTAGEGTYDIFMLNGDAMDGGYADYIGAGYWMDRGIYNNMVTLQSPEFAGFTAFAQYSFGTDDDAPASRDKERYAALGATFTSGNFSAVAVVDTVLKNQQTVIGSDRKIDDALAFSIGANYDMGFMKPFIGFQYGKHEQSIGGVPGFETEDTQTYIGDLDGFAVAMGSAFPVWGGELQVSVYYADGDGNAYWYESGPAEGATSYDAYKMDVKRYGVALFHNYELSKRTSLYAGIGYDYQEYDLNLVGGNEKEHSEQDGIQVGVGLVHNF